MEIVFAQQPFPDLEGKPLIFLVGPTPRLPSVPSWRPEATDILSKVGYTGVVFIPEPEGGKWKGNYIDQIDWEHDALSECAKTGCIAAWVPRDMKTMPALTTNIECGIYLESPRFLYGRPPGAERTSYFDYMYEHKAKHGKPCETLEDLMLEAIDISEMKSEPNQKIAEEMAELFHETYEKLAPDFDYETREGTKKPWADIPDDDPNKRLMIAVCQEMFGVT